MQFADVERLIDTPMKRYSSGLYARLGFTVAIHSNPDIVLVDEVLVGRRCRVPPPRARGAAAADRRRQDRALHLARHVERAPAVHARSCGWRKGACAPYGAAGDIAERYMNEVNLQALANEATALQSHRGGTGEIRYDRVECSTDAARRQRLLTPGDTLVVRAVVSGDARRCTVRCFRWPSSTSTPVSS